MGVLFASCSPSAALRPCQVTSLDRQIAALALPTLGTLAADPLASLVDTAYIGHLGAVQLGGVGVALSVFGTATKLMNMPLLSVTTQIVATAVGSNEGSTPLRKRRIIGLAASSALFIAALVGAVQLLLLLAAGEWALGCWGVPPESPLHASALAFLRIKAIGAPASSLLLVSQGVFRGLGDARTPLAATLGCNALNLALDPLLIFAAGWGVAGAAQATVLAELLAAAWLLRALSKRCALRFAGRLALAQGLRFLGPTGLLMARTVAIGGTFALAASLAARSDAAHAAAHQACLQVWLGTSLLSDSLAVAAQSLVARGLAAQQPATARAVVARTAQLSGALGFALLGGLGACHGLLPRLFSSDPAVLAAAQSIVPWVILSQPVTSLAFTLDGVLYGVGGFAYAARTMGLCAAPAVACMLLGGGLLSGGGTPTADAELAAVWAGLVTLMAARALAIAIPYWARRPPFGRLFGDS
ncbi:hypothetical protein WJX81_001184 [Elliptochloris bilobata]|uniref:Protein DETOXIFICATION n=1 Tax=Elliptochloris bilobata TaxID=381761 RepID=A0AAW1RSY9_9CHLO